MNPIPKITQDHINPKRKEMKVSLAAQIFSNSFSTAIYMSIHPEHRKILDKDKYGEKAYYEQLLKLKYDPIFLPPVAAAFY